MEPMLQGLRRLIDFALSSPYHAPPRLLFASSIGVVKSTVHFLKTRLLILPLLPKLVIPNLNG